LSTDIRNVLLVFIPIGKCRITPLPSFRSGLLTTLYHVLFRTLIIGWAMHFVENKVGDTAVFITNFIAIIPLGRFSFAPSFGVSCPLCGPIAQCYTGRFAVSRFQFPSYERSTLPARHRTCHGFVSIAASRFLGHN
jgi:hypothetical protein